MQAGSFSRNMYMSARIDTTTTRTMTRMNQFLLSVFISSWIGSKRTWCWSAAEAAAAAVERRTAAVAPDDVLVSTSDRAGALLSGGIMSYAVGKKRCRASMPSWSHVWPRNAANDTQLTHT